MSGKNKILEQIHPLLLIREVQKRPVIYSRNCPEMANIHFRYQIWSEVAQSLFPEWHLYSEKSRDEKVNGLMKKWRNLRDTFKRQLEVEKKIRAGHVIKKKVYVYFKHMSFLLPHVQGDDGQGDGSPDGESSSQRDSFGRKGSPRKKGARPPDLASFPTSVYVEEIDEDKHFLMSLVPSFKRMTEDEKLTAKMEILKVIQSVKKNSAAEAVDRLSFHEVDCMANDTNLIGVKLEVAADLTEVSAQYVPGTDQVSNVESE